VPAAGVALALAVGVFAGTALAGGGGNGPVAGKASVTPHFSTGTAVKVKAAAVINANATVARASTLTYHVTSVTSLGTGIYDLRFSHSIGGCAWFGTVGLGTFSGLHGPGADHRDRPRRYQHNGLYITTFNGTGAPTNEPFHVIVVC
jgi:hypothetical protein